MSLQNLYQDRATMEEFKTFFLTVLQEETRKWLEAVKELEKTCDTEYVRMRSNHAS